MARFEWCDREGWVHVKGETDELAGPACVRADPDAPTSRRIALALEIWLALCVVSFGVLLLLDEALDGHEVWGPMPPDYDAATSHHWCERLVPERFARSPANTYSSLIFVFAGWAVLCIGFVYRARPARNHHRAFAGFTVLQALWLIVGGLAALLTHADANQNTWTIVFDHASIWPMVTLPLALFALRLVPYGRLPWLTERWYGYWLLFGGYLLLVTALVLPVLIGQMEQWAVDYMYYGVPASGALFIVLLIARLVVEGCYPRLYPYSTASVGLLVLSITFAVLGFALQHPDRLGVCRPDSSWFLNTHLWWHVLQAASLFLVWYWAYFEDVADAAYLEALAREREERGPRLTLLPRPPPGLFLEL